MQNPNHQVPMIMKEVRQTKDKIFQTQLTMNDFPAKNLDPMILQGNSLL